MLHRQFALCARATLYRVSLVLSQQPATLTFYRLLVGLAVAAAHGLNFGGALQAGGPSAMYIEGHETDFGAVLDGYFGVANAAQELVRVDGCPMAGRDCPCRSCSSDTNFKAVFETPEELFHLQTGSGSVCHLRLDLTFGQ